VSKQIDRYRAELAVSRGLERIALTRLLRAQTLFEKHYRNSERIEDRINNMLVAAERTAARLLGVSNDDE
jgi:hypothetical protein